VVDVKFGLRIPSFPVDGSDTGEFISQIHFFIGELERYFDSAWICDHFIPWAEFVSKEVPNLEGFTAVAYFSALYRKLKWGNVVLCNSYRNPALLAKMGATLQNLSNGRFILGIGAGWKKDEYLAYGYCFPTASVRIKQLEEAVQIIRMMWINGKATFHGKYYEVIDAVCEPRPNPVPPIMIGGGGEKLTLRVVAKYADWWNVPNVSPKIYKHKLGVLKEHCIAVNRDFDEIVKTLANIVAIAKSDREAFEMAYKSQFIRKGFEENYIIGDPEQVVKKIKEYVDLGVTYFILRFLDFPSVEGAKLFFEEVVPRLT